MNIWTFIQIQQRSFIIPNLNFEMLYIVDVVVISKVCLQI